MKYIEFLEHFPKLRRLFGAQMYVFYVSILSSVFARVYVYA